MGGILASFVISCVLGALGIFFIQVLMALTQRYRRKLNGKFDTGLLFAALVSLFAAIVYFAGFGFATLTGFVFGLILAVCVPRMI